jgi:hypothetical protein
MAVSIRAKTPPSPTKLGIRLFTGGSLGVAHHVGLERSMPELLMSTRPSSRNLQLDGPNDSASVLVPILIERSWATETTPA